VAEAGQAVHTAEAPGRIHEMGPMHYPIPEADLDTLGFDKRQIARLKAAIERHIAESRYPGAQVALARDGMLGLHQSFGCKRIGEDVAAADDRTLWLLYSQTKVLTAAAIWVLVEAGELRYGDRVADLVPGFEAEGKGDITVFEVLSHQCGFPDAEVSEDVWNDHEALRHAVCAFSLQWVPGSRCDYHPEAAHWTLAVVIESITGRDYRDVIRSAVIEPLGLADDLFVGVPEDQHARIACLYEPDGAHGQSLRPRENRAAFWRAGVPGGGGYGTARGLAAFYQMMLAGGTLNGRRLVSQRTIDYVTRNVTADRSDSYMGMPMHRGLGPHLRGHTPTIRGLGTLASPGTFGHGGVGTSYSWGDPESGVSFSYLSNSRIPDPWHSARLDIISNLVHAAIIPRN
jgi:CubicO group peptidase (beta-lactamase class C family)